MKNMKILTGTMLSLVLSAVSVYPALSRPVVAAPSGEQLLSQMIGDRTVRGTIQAIRNDQVTLRYPNGETVVVEIPENERERLGLLPGMEIEVMLEDDEMMSRQVTVVNPTNSVDTTSTSSTSTTTTTTTTTARTIRVAGDVISCEGTALQVRLPDGSIRNYVVGPQVCNESIMVPGRRIEFDIDDSNMVSNIQQPVRALW